MSIGTLAAFPKQPPIRESKVCVDRIGSGQMKDDATYLVCTISNVFREEEEEEAEKEEKERKSKDSRFRRHRYTFLRNATDLPQDCHKSATPL